MEKCLEYVQIKIVVTTFLSRYIPAKTQNSLSNMNLLYHCNTRITQTRSICTRKIKAATSVCMNLLAKGEEWSDFCLSG